MGLKMQVRKISGPQTRVPNHPRGDKHRGVPLTRFEDVERKTSAECREFVPPPGLVLRGQNVAMPAGMARSRSLRKCAKGRRLAYIKQPHLTSVTGTLEFEATSMAIDPSTRHAMSPMSASEPKSSVLKRTAAPQKDSISGTDTTAIQHPASVKLLKNVLAVDIGGTSVKILATGQTERRSFPSGPTLTPKQMAADIKRMTEDWTYELVSIGYPGPVVRGRPVAEPHNLGPGWVGFNYKAAFGCPVKVLNDAAMQALGSYEGGRMLFL